MYASVFSYFYIFPHFVYTMIGKNYTKTFSLVTRLITIILIILVFFTSLFVTDQIINFAGMPSPTKSLFAYLMVLALTIFVSYILYDVVKIVKKNELKMFNIRPMIVGIVVAVVSGIIDIAGTIVNKPLILTIRDPFSFGIFIIMFTFAWTFLSQYSMVFASLNRSKQEIENLIAKSNKNFIEFVQLIAKTLDAKDEYTAGHSLRVLDYALKIADELNFSETDKEILKQACLLHDIGKIGIPDGILNKKGPLNNKEKSYIINHPILGKKILGTVSEFQPILDIVYAHHERADGKGYPDGLNKEKIPLLARIIAVADTFDAMTSERPYRRAKSKNEAIKEIISIKDTQLDGQIVDLFLKIVNEG